MSSNVMAVVRAGRAHEGLMWLQETVRRELKDAQYCFLSRTRELMQMSPAALHARQLIWVDRVLSGVSKAALEELGICGGDKVNSLIASENLSRRRSVRQRFMRLRSRFRRNSTMFVHRMSYQ